MGKTIETKPENRLRAAGTMLLIFGVGLPVVSVIVSILYIKLSPHDEFAGLIILLTGPIIFIPIWVMQIIGGIFALQGRFYRFVLASAAVALLYWIPFLFVIMGDRQRMFRHANAVFWLYLPLLILAIAAFVKILTGKKSLSQGSSE